MFIDLTELQIQINPYMFTGEVRVRLIQHDLVDGLVLMTSMGESRVEPDSFERTSVGTFTFEVQNFNLAGIGWDDHEESADFLATDFLATSRYMDIDNEWQTRTTEISIVHRPDGWFVDLTEFSIFMPVDFRPRARITPQKAEEIQDVRPPGKPLWERLDEEG